MNNIVSYAEEQLDTFPTSPFGSADSLILSWVANLDFPPETQTWAGVPLRDLFRAELFPTLFHDLHKPGPESPCGICSGRNSSPLSSMICGTPPPPVRSSPPLQPAPGSGISASWAAPT
jgi:hypothetical protein